MHMYRVGVFNSDKPGRTFTSKKAAIAFADALARPDAPGTEEGDQIVVERFERPEGIYVVVKQT